MPTLVTAISRSSASSPGRWRMNDHPHRASLARSSRGSRPPPTSPPAAGCAPPAGRRWRPDRRTKSSSTTPWRPMLTIRMPAISGDTSEAAASPICVMPAARPRCRLGTSSEVAALKAGQLRVLKLEMIGISTKMCQSARRPFQISSASASVARARPAVRHDHDPAPVPAVDQRPGERGEQDAGQRGRQRDEAEEGRRARLLIDPDRQREAGEVRAQGGDDLPHPDHQEGRHPAPLVRRLHGRALFAAG